MELEIYNSHEIHSKMQQVKTILQDKKVIVAFSGGVDSTVMAYLSKLYADETLLVMQTGSSVAIGEDEFAQSQADQLQLPIKFIDYDEVDYSEEYAANPSNRCYFCKELLHSFLLEIRDEKNYDIIVSGTNYTDLDGHRPGHQAAIEAGVINPLVQAKITKQDVRWIAHDAGLNAWDKPASACLASRFVTGVEITKAGLARVAQAEHFIKSTYSIRVLRVRDHGGLARLEIGVEELSNILDQDILENISKELKKLGFEQVTLDMEGYRPYIPPVEP